MQSLFKKLKKAEEQHVVPSVVAYNRIDGPGSSLDIREFQQALWRKTDVTAFLTKIFVGSLLNSSFHCLSVASSTCFSVLMPVRRRLIDLSDIIMLF